MKLDISKDDLNEMYEYIQVQLGGEDVEVEITKKEIKILARKALKDYWQFIDNWQIKNNFSNVLGFSAHQDFTKKFVTENPMIAQRISDWFASLARVGGKTNWKKDYFTLNSKQQVYDLSKESSTPYKPGSRRIHKIMWYAKPEIMGGQFDPGAIDGGLVTFGSAGMMYGANLMSYLGNIFDVIMIAQSLEERNKVLRSEFFYNISGDIVEITPSPNTGLTGLPSGAKVFYYYFDEQDFLGLEGQKGPDGEEDVNELIANPVQVQVDMLPYSDLNSPAKNWVENYTLTLSKYAFASKLRAIRKIASPDSDYQVEFDYNSLLEESKAEKEKLFEDLQEYLDLLDMDKLMERKWNTVDYASKINNKSPRKIFVG